MGLGIDIRKDGHNVVFAGGTGILVFLDIVGLMITHPQTFPANFHLTLYFTAPTRADAIGIELLENFARISQKFTLHLRLSDASEKQPRWDAQFLEQELAGAAGKPTWRTIKQFGQGGALPPMGVDKVIACGSPLMNEVFDRAFEDGLRAKMGLQW
jgi:NAD(P)H-flavin reductase